MPQITVRKSFVLTEYMTALIVCDSVGLKRGNSITYFTNASVLFTNTPIYPPTLTSHVPFTTSCFIPVPLPTMRPVLSVQDGRSHCVSFFTLIRSHQAPSLLRPALPNPAIVLLCLCPLFCSYA